MTSWEFPKIPIEKKVGEEEQSLPNYSGELAESFTSYSQVDLSTSTLYFKAPAEFLGKQINSYGGYLNYQITYSGYELENVPTAPDVFIVGNDISLLFHSGQKPQPNQAMNISAPMDPYYWVLPSGAKIERHKLMVALANLEGIYIRASYGLDTDGQARLSQVALDSAVEVPGDREMTEQDLADQVTRFVMHRTCLCIDNQFNVSIFSMSFFLHTVWKSANALKATMGIRASTAMLATTAAVRVLLVLFVPSAIVMGMPTLAIPGMDSVTT